MTIGKVEALVLRAWGHGVQIDRREVESTEPYAKAFVTIVDEARQLDLSIEELQASSGRCTHIRFTDEGPMNRCTRPHGHDGDHQ